MKSPLLTLSAMVALGAASTLPSSAATSEILGYNTITCLPNSDTIVGVPLRQSGSIKGALNGTVTDNGNDTATLTLAAAPSQTDDDLAFSHYLQFTSGTKNGQYFTIGANSGTSVTIDLNGGNVTGVIGTTTESETADTFIIAKYWTLDELFPPAEATTSWDGSDVPNGHAIVASGGTSLLFRKTQLLISSSSSEGINLPASNTYYITGGEWRSASVAGDQGLTLLLPDTSFTIRHPSNVSKNTYYTSVGEVDSGAISIPLPTLADGAQDVKLALPRPVDVQLDELNLISSGAFVGSSGNSLLFRKDQLYVYDNTTAGINKPASRIYFYNTSTGNWINSDGNVVANSDTIPAGSGFMIRKAKGSGASSEWVNTPSY